MAGARQGPAVVSRAALERALAGLRARTADPRGGIFGPGSRVWAINRESAVFLGGGRAALLQLAHPFVAHAVAQHSSALRDPLGRFLRTFDHVFAMVFGDLDSAVASARRVHAIHTSVVGTMREATGTFARGARYAANVPDALLWVHATLWDTSILVHETLHGPLPPQVKTAYYEETKRFAALFGIPDAILPPDWGAFQAYVAGMLDSPLLAAGPTARALAAALLRPSDTWIGPVWRWYAAVTARLMPARLRDEFALPWGAVDRALAETSLRAARAGLPLLPDRLRWLPAYVDAAARVAGRRPDALAQLVDRAWRRAQRARTAAARGDRFAKRRRIRGRA